jgi:hypothetical protein
MDLHPSLTFAAGANASGKSSLVDAVLWCLTGTCRGTDAKGAGSKDLIRDGQDSAQVRLVFQDGTYQTRAISKKGGTILDPPDGIAVNKDVLRCLCDGAAFLDFAHADAKKLLIGVLGVTIDYGGESLSLEQVEAKYQIAFEARRNAKAKLNAIQIPALPTGEVPDIEKLDKKLTGLRAEEHVLAAKDAHGGGKREALAGQLERAQAALTKAVAAFEAQPSAAELDAQIEAVDALVSAPAETTAHADAVTEQAEVAGQLAKFRDGSAWLLKHTPSSGCVISAQVPCRTATAEFVEETKSIKKQMTALETRQKELAATLQAEAQADKARRDAADKRAALVKAADTRQRLAAAAVDAETEVTRLTAELKVLPAETGPSAALVTLRERIAKGEQIVRDAREVVRQRIAHEDATKAQAQAAEALQKIETVVTDLGPKGLRVDALASTVGAFEAQINNALTPFGYTLAFQVDPWDVRVNGRSAELLSTSERLRVGCAFALALAESTGIGFVCFDGADLLDTAGRAVFGELVANWDAGQIIVAATRAEPLESNDFLTAYWLERDGEGATTVTRT